MRSVDPRRKRTFSIKVAFLCLLDLTWRDLLDVGRETRVTMPVRRLANEKLREKLEKLAVGEKISLARLADRSLHTRLLEESGRVRGPLDQCHHLDAKLVVVHAQLGEARRTLSFSERVDLVEHRPDLLVTLRGHRVISPPGRSLRPGCSRKLVE